MAQTQLDIPSSHVIFSPHSSLQRPDLPVSTVQESEPSRNRKYAISSSSKPQSTRIVGNAEHGPAVDKRKQSKSRNGCVTCKAKRLKCDETKPVCTQCVRRGVTCGGYRKDYKWRSFEETRFALAKTQASRPRKNVGPHKRHPSQQATQVVASRCAEKPVLVLATVQAPGGEAAVAEKADISNPGSLYQREVWIQSSPGTLIDMSTFLSKPNGLFNSPSPLLDSFSAPLLDLRGEGGGMLDPMFDNLTKHKLQLSPIQQQPPNIELPGSLFLLPVSPTRLEIQNGVRGSLLSPVPLDEMILSERNNERPDFSCSEPERFTMRLPDFYSSQAVSNAIPPGSELFSLLREPRLPGDSPEMLTVHFDRQTCGILSVKDGPTENPWRTMVWPLARDSPALYHAIASMTSFHISKNSPGLRVRGIEHMRASIRALASGIGEMKFETAIATTLALAFAESWDTHTSTGINHIKGANILVKQAIEWHRKRPFQRERLRSLQFLCNAWVYMDVIARLTSSDDDDDSTDFDVVFAKLTDLPNDGSYLDPLMGAASTLFPIIGRVANLVRRARKLQCNSPAIISQAMELKSMLEVWTPPLTVETPEDPSSLPQHSLHTAEAYRWATLLYLHQAVPEIPFQSSANLAKNVFLLLNSVPMSSRTVIVQIYPLLAAGCEAVDEEDRQWVRERWQSMALRMKIGVINCCADVVKEVWARRDAYELQKASRKLPPSPPFNSDQSIATKGLDPGFSDFFLVRQRGLTSDPVGFAKSPGEEGKLPAHDPQGESETVRMDFEYTVKGSLHWLGVMGDWQWEVLLG